MAQFQPSKRKFIKAATYVAPAILTLKVAPTFASGGSGHWNDDRPGRPDGEHHNGRPGKGDGKGHGRHSRDHGHPRGHVDSGRHRH